MSTLPSNASIDPAEVAKFSELAGQWWDPGGKMAILHRFNRVRLGFIRDVVCRQFDRDPKRLDCLAHLRLLDIGCGGGILCEPLARLGAMVVGADPSAINIEAAKHHAAVSGVRVDYRATTAEALAEAREAFDVVLAMEVVEHVANVCSFVSSCAAMVNPGGVLVVATINRTLKSFAFAIVGAEYLLGWLPRGTHRWEKFVTPSELETAIDRCGLRITEWRGVGYSLWADSWQLGDDIDVNYMVAANRPRERVTQL
jgi:2-polyprenyl-6-hydroxyphenyl methylase / 3-demethylubiquinone-9 3-methyltransferase